MKRIILILLCSAGALAGYSQTSKTLITDQGEKLVSINSEGVSEISFSYEEFAKVTSSKAGKICIHIASSKRNCNSGIGFNCTASGCGTGTIPSFNAGRARDRLQNAEVLRNADNVILKFPGLVDWDYLGNN